LVAVVDDADYDRLSQWKWCALKSKHTFYAVRRAKKGVYPRFVFMHRIILPGQHLVDHKDGDGLNNQRDNLRACTRSQNAANAGPQRNNTSGYKGVSFQGGRWVAQTKIDGKNRRLGSFSTPEEASKAYLAAIMERHGEFARTEPFSKEKST
jgi:hypothetical protein